MKKILTILVSLLIWGAILILCGEKAENISWTSFYVWKAVAVVVLFFCARWLDRKELAKQ